MAEIISHPNFEIIRKACGSPAVTYTFSDKVMSFIVDNFGGSPIFTNFDTTADTGSTNYFIPANEWRSFDLQCGSISVMGSGGATHDIQVMGLR